MGGTQDSVSIKDLSECQLFSSVCMLTVNCEESDCSLVNCHIVCFFGAWGSRVVKALRYKSGGPGIDSRNHLSGVDPASECEFHGFLLG